MRILISACLLGARCRYDGVSKLQPWISDLAERHILVPVCPEQLGGLPTPRPPAERRGDRVMTRDGWRCHRPIPPGRGRGLASLPPAGMRGGAAERAESLLRQRDGLRRHLYRRADGGRGCHGGAAGAPRAFRCTESPGWRSWRTPSKQARQPRTAQRPENGAAPFFSSPARFTTRGKRGRLEAMNMGEEGET